MNSAVHRITVSTLAQGILAGCLLLATHVHAAAWSLVSADQVATVFVPQGEPECVRLAAADLFSDVQKITGQTLPAACDARSGCGRARLAGPARVRRAAGETRARLRRRAERQMGSVSRRERRLAADHRRQRRTRHDVRPVRVHREIPRRGPALLLGLAPAAAARTLAWDNVKLRSDEPTFRFRGWFINDEDLLTEWKDGGGKRRIDYPYYGQVVSREVMRAVAEALVRSRFNLIIPASFVDILNPPEEALVQECARRGVFVSQHHVEPLGVSAFGYFNYWKKRGRDLKYSYFSHPAEVREVWRVYAEKWSAYPNVIWQLGLRGIADRPMWLADPNTPQSDADRGQVDLRGDGGSGEDSGRGVPASAALPLHHALGGRFGAQPARAAHDPGRDDHRLRGQLAGLEVAAGLLLDAAQSAEHLRRLLPSRADRFRPAPGPGAVAAQDLRVPEDRRRTRAPGRMRSSTSPTSASSCWASMRRPR